MANAYQFDMGYVCDQCAVCSQWHINGLARDGTGQMYYTCRTGANQPGTVVNVTVVAGPPPAAVIAGIETKAQRG